MVVPQSLPLNPNASFDYQQQNQVDGVHVPGDMTYGYLRREIMVGTMSVDTIVRIGYNDYYSNYSPAIFDSIDNTENVKKSEDNVDSDDDYDYGEDFEDFLDMPPLGAPIDNLLAFVGANQGGIIDNLASQPIGGNQASQEDSFLSEMYASKSLTILHIAIMRGDDDLVEYLLENRADIMKSTRDCGPIIFLAVGMKKTGYVKRFLDAGFLLDHRAKTPELSLYGSHTVLEVAINLNDYKMIEFLISQGAEVNVEESHGLNSPFEVAAKKGNVKIMKFLIKHGAIVNEKVLTSVCTYGPSLKVVKFMLRHPAVKLTSGGRNRPDNGDCKHDSLEKSILFWPLMSGSKKVLSCLLNAGADVNVVGKDGKMFYDIPGMVKGCVELIKEHVVKLIVAGFYVCEENRKIVSDEEYEGLILKCQEEVEVMKIVPVSGTDLTCYDLLHKPDDELTLCLKHFDNCVVMEDILLKTFPLYGGMIAWRIDKNIVHCT